jgi:hypothetical protein
MVVTDWYAIDPGVDGSGRVMNLHAFRPNASGDLVDRNGRGYS